MAGLTRIKSDGIGDGCDLDGEGTLVLDSTNNRVGIGDTSPDAKLSVNGHIKLQGLGRIGTGGSGDTPTTSFRFSDNSHINAYVGNSEKLRIDSSGNVGIGTSSPSAALHIQGNSTSGYAILAPAANDKWLTLAGSFGDPVIAWNSSNSLRFGTSTSNTLGGFTERMRIDSSGKVGIALTPTSATLEVAGQNVYTSSANSLATSTTKAAFRVKGSSNSSDSLWMGVETANANPYIQGANGIGSGSKSLLLNPFGGNVGIGTTSPGASLDIDNSADSSGTKSLDVKVVDNTAEVVHIAQGSNEYLSIDTTNSSELITIGNNTTNPNVVVPGGDVGIGTTAPQSIFHIQGPTDAADKARLTISERRNTGTTNWGIDFLRTYDSGGDNQAAGFVRCIRNGGASNAGMAFGIGNQTDSSREKMRIDSSGNVGIGTTSPGSLLEVAGKTVVGSTSSNALEVFSNGDTEIGFSYATKGNIYAKIIGDITVASPLGGDIAFQTAAGGTLGERMRITSTGDLRFNSGFGSVATAYGVRAWVNFNGTGTVAINGSGNVSSITDNATGSYLVNFTNNMPDTEYVCSGHSASNLAINGQYENYSWPNSTSRCNVRSMWNGVDYDLANVGCTVVR